ncbi:ankyrin repeat and SOCS box protein 3-like [Haliotis asinina]|uniref:ankyrin repeat and SOCS box protein 3-like n=1 Tax=Haliotis asinina TaxID=109174 RepID=UPI0035318D80
MNFSEAYAHTCSTVGAAARAGDLMALQQLVWNGGPVDVRDNRGWRPIHEAASYGHPGCLEFLLRQDETDPDWVSFAEETALLLAARHCHLDCVRVLLSFQADPNIATNEGFTPLWEATKMECYECCRLLIRRGADTNTKMFTNYTPLHLAVEKGLDNLVEYLLNHGAKLDVLADHHLTPIFLAAQFGRSGSLRCLLKAAKSKGLLDLVNEGAEDNASPLLIAAQEGHEECVQLLLEAGANANMSVRDINAVPLQYAVYKGHIGCVKRLLPVTQLHVFRETYSDMHPLLLALKLSNTFILKTLLTSGFDPSLSLPLDADQLAELSPLATDIASATHGSVLCHVKDDWPLDGVSLLLKAGLTPNSQTKKDLPPLLVMLWNKNFQFYRLLLEHGANPNIYHDNIVGNIAMLLALRNDIHKAETDKCSYECPTHLQYLWPLLVAGGEAVSLFASPSIDCDMDTGDRISLLHLLKTQDRKSSLPIVGFLLFFCHFVDISSDVCDLFDPEDAKTLQRISASTKSLAHICRRKIVLELASYGKFNKKTLESIPLPSTIKEYLRFTEFGTLGHFVLDLQSNQLSNDSVQ